MARRRVIHKMHNPEFKGVEFDPFRMDIKVSNSTPLEWI